MDEGQEGKLRAALANDLGVAHLRMGDLTRALAAFRTALAADPGSRAARRNLATTLFEAERYDEALPLLEGELARDPADADLLTAVAYALRRLERPLEALGIARRLAEFAPGPRADELTGACLRDLGRFSEALAAFDRAAGTATPRPTALAARAETLADLGDLDGARAAAAAAVAADPACAAAWSALAALRRFAAGDPELATLEALAGSPALTRPERVLLAFAAGRAQLGAGEADRAFAHFHRGNRLRRAAIDYDVATDERRADAIVAAFDPATLARLAGGGAPDAQPLFVVGLPRSGTSLVEQILASVPGVAGAGEVLDAPATIAAAGDYPELIARLEPADVQRLGAQLAARLRQRAPGAARVVDKLPANVWYAGLLHLMLPHATIVHCVRDPLDTALSLYTQLFSGRQDFAYDLAEIARYIRAEERVVAHWRRVLPATAFVEVRYEQIVTDFEPAVRRLLAACRLPWSERTRDFHQTQRAVTTASRIAVRTPLYASSIGGARRYATHLRPLFDILG